MARDMASALNPESQQTTGKVSKQRPPSSAPTQRKRRKRTTGNNGAADDCFTCANRGTKCDRRRPYCTQCLNLGRNCSGYKTTLTWGVGVASRGKLRGFSLPVNNQKKDAGRDTQDKPKSGLVADELNAQQPPEQLSGVSPVDQDAPSDFQNFQPVESGGYGSSSLHQGISSTVSSNVESLNTPTVGGPGYQSNFYAERRIPIASPSLTLPTSQISHPYHASASNSPVTHTSSSQSDYIHWQRAPGSTSSLMHPPIPHRHHDIEGDDDDIEEIPHNPEVSHMPINSQSRPPEDSWIPTTGSVTLMPQLNFSQSIGQTPRLRYLISYYSEVISPVIVAFDSPANPYRSHILRLAQESKTLQHAIAALSASNLRQRRDGNIVSNGRTLPARRSSLAHSAMTDNSLQAQFGIFGPSNDMKEETFHQRAAIQSLNAQLADPIRRRADSVLATLLVLSLFHICDSGVSSFQTQFAGVKKLLALRGTGLGTTSEESKWYTKMFTFFDVLTATTNDREGQLQGMYLDLATIPDNDFPLENLVGCDGRLFKIIARLNHLNVLSQNKTVTDYPITDSSIPFVPLPPSMTHFSSSYPHNSQYIPNFSSYNSATAMHTDPDSRTEFWKEWRSIRRSLESWRLGAEGAPYNSGSQASSDSSSSSSSPSPPGLSSTYFTPPSSPISPAQVSPDNIPDLSNISEAFRYSALIYTERLADPRLPSSHPLIQNLVLASLHYISAVRSDVYLLWPLFVTGTECVIESQRAIIRQRCQGIQKDSGFFNNRSCLELLEKIWARNDQAESTDPYTVDSFGNIRENIVGTSRPSAPGGQAFSWRTVMDEEALEGEYILV